MERNITIGLVIALVLTCVGAFWMSSNSNGSGGFLLDFLKNNTNTTTADNSTINNTNNSTINQTTNQTDNSTNVTKLSFSIAAVYDNSTNSSLVSITSEKNMTVDELALFMSYNNSNFTKVHDENNVTLPTTITVPINDNATKVYFYATALYNTTLYRAPKNGSEVLNISTH